MIRRAFLLGKHIKGHLETWHVGWVSIRVHGKKILVRVTLAINMKMAVGGLTAEVLPRLREKCPVRPSVTNWTEILKFTQRVFDGDQGTAGIEVRVMEGLQHAR